MVVLVLGVTFGKPRVLFMAYLGGGVRGDDVVLRSQASSGCTYAGYGTFMAAPEQQGMIWSRH